MLVLSAAHYNPVMKDIVPADRLKQLLERTITFLRRLSAISPTSMIDCVTLEKIKHALFPHSQEDKHIYKNEGVEHMSASGSFSAST
jgi:hypothetical protein